MITIKLSKKQINRHKRTYGFFRWLLKRWICSRYAYSFKKENLPDPPYIILSNHNTELDPIIVGMSFPHTYFVASEHLFNKGFLSKILVRYFSPIPRMKGRTDASTVLELRRRLQQGCNICIFPEGNRSFDGRTMKPHPSIGALVRSCNVPLVTFRLEGGFLTNPRWSLSVRKGKMNGHIVNIYQPENLKSLTPERINELIYTDIFEDAYEDQKSNPVLYKGKNLALGLESAFYLCPCCKRTGYLSSDAEKISCTCGMEAVYNEYGFFISKTNPHKTFTDWYDWQYTEFKAICEDTYTRFNAVDSDLLIYKIEADRTHKKLRFTNLKMNTENLVLSACDGEYIFFDTVSITGMSVYSRNSLVFEAKNSYYEIKPSKKNRISFNARKYTHIYEFSRNTENTSGLYAGERQKS